MQHIAIDLGGTKSQVCVRAPDGTLVMEKALSNSSIGPFLEKQPHSRVVLETCAEAFGFADMALALDHEVRVVPAALVKTLGVGSRGVKTDQRDAQILSQVSCRIDLPSVHVPSEVARKRRNMCQVREELVSTRTSLINCARGWARTQLLKIPQGVSHTFGTRLRRAAKQHPQGLPEYIDRMLVVLDTLNDQIKLADKELLTLAKEDPTCVRLMSVPGIGPVTSIRFVAALDDRSRFTSAHSVQSYLGLTPGENSSSKRQQRTGITKAGPSGIRKALVQSAWTIQRSRPLDPISQWAAQIALRRGKFVATVAVARKLAGILFAMWRDGTMYSPELTAMPTIEH